MVPAVQPLLDRADDDTFYRAGVGGESVRSPGKTVSNSRPQHLLRSYADAQPVGSSLPRDLHGESRAAAEQSVGEAGQPGWPPIRWLCGSRTLAARLGATHWNYPVHRKPSSWSMGSAGNCEATAAGCAGPECTGTAGLVAI